MNHDGNMAKNPHGYEVCTKNGGFCFVKHVKKLLERMAKEKAPRKENEPGSGIMIGGGVKK